MKPTPHVHIGHRGDAGWFCEQRQPNPGESHPGRAHQPDDPPCLHREHHRWRHRRSRVLQGSHCIEHMFDSSMGEWTLSLSVRTGRDQSDKATKSSSNTTSSHTSAMPAPGGSAESCRRAGVIVVIIAVGSEAASSPTASGFRCGRCATPRKREHGSLCGSGSAPTRFRSTTVKPRDEEDGA